MGELDTSWSAGVNASDPCNTERVSGAHEDESTFEARLRRAIGHQPVDRVARESKVGRRTLRDLLEPGRRKRGCYLETITLLAAYLHVSAAWLAFGQGTPELKAA